MISSCEFESEAETLVPRDMTVTCSAALLVELLNFVS
jgi:hypothetical protein